MCVMKRSILILFSKNSMFNIDHDSKHDTQFAVNKIYVAYSLYTSLNKTKKIYIVKS